MIFKQIADLFEKINSISSRLGKEELLKLHDCVNLREVLDYALNPYITFGVAKFHSHDVNDGQSADWLEIRNVLSQLRDRKITGNAARNELINLHLIGNEKKLLMNILNKDLRCGVSVKTVNKIFGDFIPVFECQLADKNVNKIKFPCIVEAKYDGVRTLAFVENGNVIYYSRNGKVFENFLCFDKDLLKMGNGVYDGEVIGVDFNTLMTEAKRKYDVKDIKKTYVIFDYLTLSEFKSKQCTYHQNERKLQLESRSECFAFDHIKIEFGIVAKEMNLVENKYNEYVNDGFEGIIIKNPNSIYEFKRSNNWIKMKPTATLDLEIVDVKEGKGKYKGKLGSFIVDHKGVKVDVGSGFSDEQRCDFWSYKDQYHIGKIIEVRFQEVTLDGSLRFPTFRQFRPDKED